MQRLTAKFLLLVALTGNLVPLALAATAAPLHACCLRKAHKCHSVVVTESNQLNLYAIGSCGHDCCRSVTTSQWASPETWINAVVAQLANGNVANPATRALATPTFALRSTRAPPAC
jgi:hypothetical protein